MPTPDTTDTLADAQAYCLQLRSHGPLEALHCELCAAGGIVFCEWVNYVNYECAIGTGYLTHGL